MSMVDAIQPHHAWPGESTAWGDWIRRSRSYWALGQLLHGAESVSADQIELLLHLGCDCPSGAHLGSDDLMIPAAAAREALLRPEARTELKDEWVRLFGESEFRALTDAISPCEVVYVAEPPEVHQRTIVEAYESVGFDCAEHLTCHCDCPGHVAVEFVFMAYVLERASAGDMAAAAVSADFVRNHILNWVPLFAVALQHKVRHPVMRFAAIATERFMCCEARRAGLTRTR